MAAKRANIAFDMENNDFQKRDGFARFLEIQGLKPKWFFNAVVDYALDNPEFISELQRYKLSKSKENVD